MLSKRRSDMNVLRIKQWQERRNRALLRSQNGLQRVHEQDVRKIEIKQSYVLDSLRAEKQMFTANRKSRVDRWLDHTINSPRYAREEPAVVVNEDGDKPCDTRTQSVSLPLEQQHQHDEAPPPGEHDQQLPERDNMDLLRLPSGRTFRSGSKSRTDTSDGEGLDELRGDSHSFDDSKRCVTIAGFSRISATSLKSARNAKSVNEVRRHTSHDAKKANSSGKAWDKLRIARKTLFNGGFYDHLRSERLNRLQSEQKGLEERVNNFSVHGPVNPSFLPQIQNFENEETDEEDVEPTKKKPSSFMVTSFAVCFRDNVIMRLDPEGMNADDKAVRRQWRSEYNPDVLRKIDEEWRFKEEEKRRVRQRNLDKLWAPIIRTTRVINSFKRNIKANRDSSSDWCAS